MARSQKRKYREQENRCQPRPSCHTSWNIVHLSAQKISYQHGGRHFSKDHVYVRLGEARNFMEAHLSPSHIHSRKCLHFFSLGLQIGPALHNPLSYFPFFSWFKSIRLSGVGLYVHEFTYLVPQCCWLEAHQSIGIFTTPLFRLHQPDQTTRSGRKWEPSTPLNPLSCTP